MKLGKFEINNIYNEDCYKAIKCIPDRSIDLIVTDPPYEYIKLPQKRKTDTPRKILKAPQGTINRQKKANWSELLPLAYGFDLKLLDEFCRVMKKINCYIWCSKRQVGRIIAYWEQRNCNIEIITWHKTNIIPAMNGTYANDTEYCVFAREKNVPLYGDYYSKRKYYVTKTNVADKSKFEHPTIKPLRIIENLIKNSSLEGDIVADFFVGSGTTPVGAKNLKRNYIGFEIDSKWHKIAVDRTNNIDATGQESLFTI